MIKSLITPDEEAKILEGLLETTQSLDEISNVEYNGLIWESAVPRDEDGVKKLFYFDDSQERLVRAGYKRHPLSNEVFGLICQYLDDQKNDSGVLNAEQKRIAQDILSNKCEFLCQVVRTTEDGILRIYQCVTGLPRNQQNKGYDINQIT